MLAELAQLVGRRSMPDRARDHLLRETAARATQIHPKVLEGVQKRLAGSKQERFCRVGRHAEHDRRLFGTKTVDVVQQERGVVTIVECLQRLLDTAAEIVLLPVATASPVQTLIRLAEPIIGTSGALKILADTDRRMVERRPGIDSALVQQDLPVGHDEDFPGDGGGVLAAARQAQGEVVEGKPVRLEEGQEGVALAGPQIFEEGAGKRAGVDAGHTTLITGFKLSNHQLLYRQAEGDVERYALARGSGRSSVAARSRRPVT